jgi:two-component sensor histidine kinase
VNIHSPPEQIELGRSLARALANTGITVIHQDSHLRVNWARNVPGSWTRHDIVGLTDPEYLPAADMDRVVQLKRQVLESGRPVRFEMRHSGGSGSRWYDVWLDADRADDGTTIGLVTTMVETTLHKHREQTLRALLREVSHRSKNLLAIIQSIATQTGRYSGSMEVFLSRFRGRLQSLASSQDLVTSSNWRGAMFSELIEGQVARYCEDPAYSIRTHGADPRLSPNAALHVGLALHELVVNSLSHGALSQPNGYVSVSGQMMEDAGGSNQFLLIWREMAPKPDVGQLERRFGSVTLERVVPASLDGEAHFSVADGRIEYRLRIPEGNFEID